MRLQAGPLLLVFALGCIGSQQFPGTEIMGTFDFTVTPDPANDCPYADQPDGGFNFTGTFSWNQILGDGGQVWFTFNGLVPAGSVSTFDGQFATYSGSTTRNFDECVGFVDAGAVPVNETLRVALLSGSQTAATGDRCPPNPLDGGVPVPNDAGISATADDPSGGFDAKLACGEMTDQVNPPGGGTATCVPCTLKYALSGVRR